MAATEGTEAKVLNATEEMKECVQNLEYLTTVGYTKEHVKTLKNYYKEQQYDVDAIKEDLDDIEQCLVLDEIKEEYPDWDEKRLKDFYNKVRQALGLDPKAYTAQNAIPQSKIKPENISFEMKEQKLENTRSDSKMLILIRHGQALHNISSDYWYTPDNPLTDDGESQLKNVRLNLMQNHKKEFYESIELVITTPLLRALQTTYILFHGLDIPILVSPHHTEIYSAECDTGTSTDVLLKKYPQFKAYKGWDSIPTKGWYPSGGESDEVIANRHVAFAEMVMKQEKKCIAAVGHSTYFRLFTDRFGTERAFGNGEANIFTLTNQKDTYSLEHIQKIAPPK